MNKPIITEDEINDISVNIVGEMVLQGYVQDCTDTDDETELDIQDLIREILIKHFKL